MYRGKSRTTRPLASREYVLNTVRSLREVFFPSMWYIPLAIACPVAGTAVPTPAEEVWRLPRQRHFPVLEGAGGDLTRRSLPNSR